LYLLSHALWAPCTTVVMYLPNCILLRASSTSDAVVQQGQLAEPDMLQAAQEGRGARGGCGAKEGQ
jgi:hypothetical protein